MPGPPSDRIRGARLLRPYAPYEGLAGTYALSAAHLAGARGPDRAREPPQVGQWGITRVGAPLNVQGGALRLTATAMCKEHLIGGLVRGSLPGGSGWALLCLAEGRFG